MVMVLMTEGRVLLRRPDTEPVASAVHDRCQTDRPRDDSPRMVFLIALSVLLLLALAAALAAMQSERRLRVHEARAADEKIELLRGERDAFRQEMQEISGEVLSGATAELTKLAAEARKADQATAAGELGQRAAQITAAVAPIAEHLGKVQAQVEQLQQDRQATHATVRQLFERTTSELGKLRMERRL